MDLKLTLDAPWPRDVYQLVVAGLFDRRPTTTGDIAALIRAARAAEIDAEVVANAPRRVRLVYPSGGVVHYFVDYSTAFAFGRLREIDSADVLGGIAKAGLDAPARTRWTCCRACFAVAAMLPVERVGRVLVEPSGELHAARCSPPALW